MKFAFVKFYDLVYTSAWEETKLEIEDTIHTGIGILLEDADTHIMIAMAMGNNPNQPLSKLLIPKPMIISYVIMDEASFTDRLFTNGLGSIKDGEKTSDSSDQQVIVQQGKDNNPESTDFNKAFPRLGK